MNIKKELNKKIKLLGLRNKQKEYSYMVCTKEDITISNFLGDCPDPNYIKYRKLFPKNIEKSLKTYLSSKEHKIQLKYRPGRVISSSELNKEIKIIRDIKDKKLRTKLNKFYEKVRKKMNDRNKLTLVFMPSKKEKKRFEKVLIHELMHELMDENNLRMHDWRWNEGLMTYLEYKSKEFIKKPKKEKNKMWNAYAQYAHKWALLFKDAKTPKDRYEIIKNKAKEINTKKH